MWSRIKGSVSECKAKEGRPQGFVTFIFSITTDLISTQNPKGDIGLEVGVHQHVNLNTGIYFVKSTAVSETIFDPGLGEKSGTM